MQDDYSMETFFTFAAPNMMSDDNCCDCLDQMPLAMAYVPLQEFKDLFEDENTALDHGTLFKQLYKPWYGNRKRGGAQS